MPSMRTSSIKSHSFLRSTNRVANTSTFFSRARSLSFSIVSIVAIPRRAEIDFPQTLRHASRAEGLELSHASSTSRSPVIPPHKALASVNVWRNAKVLISKPLTRATATSLHFVEHQQYFVRFGKLAQALKKAVRWNLNATLSLNRFNQNRTRLVVDEFLYRVEIAKKENSEIPQQAALSLRDISCAGGGRRTNRATVEAAFESNDFVFLRPTMQSRQFDCSLVRLCARVAEKGLTQKLRSESSFAQCPLCFHVPRVWYMNEFGNLILDGCDHPWRAMPQSIASPSRK